MSKERPKQTDEYVLKIAMEKLFDKSIKQWLINGGDTLEYVQEEKEATIDDLVKNYDDDAYHFARNLDNCGWFADAELVECLDCYFTVRNAWEEMVKQWVIMRRTIHPNSSNIASFEYDDVTHELEITFIAGGTYVYWDVPILIADGFMVATSAGSFFHERIKNKYECRRLTPYD